MMEGMVDWTLELDFRRLSLVATRPGEKPTASFLIYLLQNYTFFKYICIISR